MRTANETRELAEQHSQEKIAAQEDLYKDILNEIDDDVKSAITNNEQYAAVYLYDLIPRWRQQLAQDLMAAGYKVWYRSGGIMYNDAFLISWLDQVVWPHDAVPVSKKQPGDRYPTLVERAYEFWNRLR